MMHILVNELCKKKNRPNQKVFFSKKRAGKDRASTQQEQQTESNKPSPAESPTRVERSEAERGRSSGRYSAGSLALSAGSALMSKLANSWHRLSSEPSESARLPAERSEFSESS